MSRRKSMGQMLWWVGGKRDDTLAGVKLLQMITKYVLYLIDLNFSFLGQ